MWCLKCFYMKTHFLFRHSSPIPLVSASPVTFRRFSTRVWSVYDPISGQTALEESTSSLSFSDHGVHGATYGRPKIANLSDGAKTQNPDGKAEDVSKDKSVFRPKKTIPEAGSAGGWHPSDVVVSEKKGKVKIVWICESCGYSEGQWWGSCRACNKVGTIKRVSEGFESGNHAEMAGGLGVSQNAAQSWLPQQAGGVQPLELTDVIHGEEQSSYRLLRPVKNRFGSTDEVPRCYSTLNRRHYLNQFSPFTEAQSDSVGSLDPCERRLIILGLSRIIKRGDSHLLKCFSRKLCPYLLVEIMKQLETRKAAVAFFKLAFGDHSEPSVKSCCLAAHLLAAGNLRMLAQDAVAMMIKTMGTEKSKELVELMLMDHEQYESVFSVLDTLMRAFVKLEMSSEALQIVQRIREVRARPSLSAVVLLIKLLLRIGDHGSVWKLLRDMIQMGPRPSNHIFNAMISGFCRNNCIRIGESLLHVMHKYGCEPGVYGFNIMVHAYCSHGLIQGALGFVSLMYETGCKPNLVTFNCLVNAYCNKGNVVEARNVFDQIHETDLSPNVIVYNSLVNGYVKARDMGQATKLYEDMKTRGLAPDGITFNILAGGYHKFGREEDIDWLVKDLMSSGLPEDGTLCEVLVAVLCWKGKLDDALRYLEDTVERGISPGVVAFNSVIDACSRQGLEEKAHETYKRMVRCGLLPSSSTCGSLLMGLSKKGKLREARELLREMMEQGLPVNKFAFTLLLEGYFKAGDVGGAQSLWNEMEGRSMFPDAVAFSVLIDGLCKAGLVEEAYYAMFLEIPRRGFVPNNFMYNSLIGAFCKSGYMDQALSLERDMRERGLVPDPYTVNIIIDGFCKQKQMRSAVNAFMEGQRNGLYLDDTIAFNTLIDGYYRASDMVRAEQIVNQMYANGCRPDMFTYNIRIHGFCSMKKVKEAVMVFEELLAAGFIPNTMTYNTMINGVCTDMMDRAMVVTGKLIKLAFFPNIVTVNTLLSQFCRQGYPEKAIKWGEELRKMSYELDDASYRIMDVARHRLHNGPALSHPHPSSHRCLFLDFLMHMTFTFLTTSKD